MAAENDSTAPLPPRAGQDQLLVAADQLNAAIGEFTAQPAVDGSDVDKAQRRNIVDAATRILDAVKNPTDQWVDVTIQIAVIFANRLFWEWGVFDAIPLDGSSISYTDLAAKVVALLSEWGLRITNTPFPLTPDSPCRWRPRFLLGS